MTLDRDHLSPFVYQDIQDLARDAKLSTTPSVINRMKYYAKFISRPALATGLLLLCVALLSPTRPVTTHLEVQHNSLIILDFPVPVSSVFGNEPEYSVVHIAGNQVVLRPIEEDLKEDLEFVIKLDRSENNLLPLKVSVSSEGNTGPVIRRFE